MNNIIRLAVILLLTTTSVAAQQPRYALKPLVSVNDGAFKNVNTISKGGKTVAAKDGKTIAYIQISTDVRDIDDDKTTFIKISGPVLLCFEGTWKNGKKEGPFNVYVIDSLDHQRRYKIWEQQFKDNRLNGEWRQYTLSGALVSLQTYENDSLKGIAREYGVDGSIINEREFLGNHREYIEHHFHPNGKIARTITIRNAIRNGMARGFYEDGKVMEEVHFEDDKFHGTRKYFYPNGQLWIEQVYNKGLSWTVISNFNAKGERRDAGSLREGNGTIIYYNEDGSVRTVSTVVNGMEQ